jgi:rhodanese-related sulfurtransferase
MGLLDALFAKNYTNLTNDELKTILKQKEDYQFVDVRTKQEFKHKRIKGFDKNIDFYKFSRNLSMLERIKKDKPVVLVCETGSRSRSTCNILHKLGYTDIYNVRGGVSSWNGVITK